MRAESLGVESSGPCVEDIVRTVDPRPLGTHVRCVLRLWGCSKRMVVRRTTRHGGAQTQVNWTLVLPTREDAL